nr:ubiquitin domain-containing protein DSK2a-like isoform X1 [Ipomoea trifida]
MHGWSDDMAVANTAEELPNVDVPVGDSFASAQFHFCCMVFVNFLLAMVFVNFIFAALHDQKEEVKMDKNGNDEIKNSENNDAIEIKIRKMFCLQTPTLRIDKCVGVGAVKEEVRLVTGVLAEHQRLIFCGKALRDDKQLSEMWKMVTLSASDCDSATFDPQESSSNEFNNIASNLFEQLSMITQMASTLLLSIGNAAANVESLNEWTAAALLLVVYLVDASLERSIQFFKTKIKIFR